MAEKLRPFTDTVKSMRDEKPMDQLENRFMSRTSNYNETVRANNRRASKGKAEKRLPSGRVAGREYRKSSR